MRIAMVDPSLFTLPYDQGLAAGLTGGGHQVSLFGRRPGADDGDLGQVPVVPEFYTVAGSRLVTALPRPLRLGIKGIDHLWSMRRLLRRLRREQPEIIHFQWLPLPLVDGRLLHLFRRVAPLVLTVHDTNPFNGDPSSRLQMRGFATLLGRLDRLIVHTGQGYDRLRAQGIAERRLSVVAHGPAAAVQPGSAAADPMAGVLSFVLFGKIKPYKGADLLIAAFARLPDRLRAQARVRIVGKPYMDLAPLVAQARAQGVADQVTIDARFVDDAEIPKIFGPGAVAVFPYREIDASGVLQQALACGRPIVAARLGCFAEDLGDGVHGHLVAPEDVDGFAAALAHLIEDRAFATGCSGRARDLARQGPDWRTVAEHTVAVYRAAGSA